MVTQSHSSATAVPRIVVVFRNDDPSGASDAAHELRVASVFERWQVPQTLGVIPMCTADDWHDPRGTKYVRLDANAPMVEFLRSAQRAGWEIALHGHTHRTNERSLPRRREYFEFKRLSVADAQERLRRGVELIEDTLQVRPETFIPPWNRIDSSSLQACADTGFQIVSAGPFVPPVSGIVNLGVDCTVAELPARVEAAARSGRLVFIRVMYHSRTTRTAAELAALQHAVRLVAELPECEVLTIREAVRRYDNAVRLVNDAAQNTVPQDEVPGTARARASVYRKVWPRGRLAKALAGEQKAASSEYVNGDYEGAAARTPTVDRFSRGLLWSGRASIFAGAFVAAPAAAIVLGSVLPPAPLYGGGTLVAVLAGIAGWWSGTSADTRREMRTAALAALAAGAAGVLVRELVMPGAFSR